MERHEMLQNQQVKDVAETEGSATGRTDEQDGHFGNILFAFFEREIQG